MAYQDIYKQIEQLTVEASKREMVYNIVCSKVDDGIPVSHAFRQVAMELSEDEEVGIDLKANTVRDMYYQMKKMKEGD